jgi:ribulose-5-phosphate 4-epimerase/fuculose-1-phosphate aldolase
VNAAGSDLRNQLAEVGRSVVAAGLVVGSGGNLSARIAGTDECWVTAAGAWLDRLDRGSFVRIRLIDGVAVDGAQAPPAATDSSAQPFASTGTSTVAPTTELALHLATYRRRPDARAVVHLHPQAVLLLDALGEPIRLVTTDHAYYLRRVVSTPFRLPGSDELADLAATAVADGTNCVVLAQHGCSVLADSVELAHKRALYLDEAARLTYQALVLGRAAALPECPAEFVARLDDPATTV